MWGGYCIVLNVQILHRASIEASSLMQNFATSSFSFDFYGDKKSIFKKLTLLLYFLSVVSMSPAAIGGINSHFLPFLKGFSRVFCWL